MKKRRLRTGRKLDGQLHMENKKNNEIKSSSFLVKTRRRTKIEKKRTYSGFV